MKLHEITQLNEARNPDFDYEETEKQVIVRLKSYNSQTYTKLAQKVERISELEAEVKALKEEVKQTTRENVADLFGAEDAVKTRIVETVGLILQLSKDPEPTKAPKYKEILEALSNHLTPELIAVLETLKESMVTVTQKAPGLKIKPLDEGRIGEFFSNLKARVLNWANNYDQKLLMLKNAIARA